MASILLTVHPNKATQEQFNESLKELVDARTTIADWPSILPQLDASNIKECVIGPNHLAFLMQDGHVCRVAFHVSAESTGFVSPKEPSDDEISPPICGKKAATGASMSGENTSTRNEHTFTLSGEALNSLSGQLGRWTTHRGSAATTSSSGTTTSTTTGTLASRVSTRGRGHIIRATRGRAGTGWLNGRAVIPASAVPEELISQAQVVLQGKSRQIIIRELQKTSLDVNLAVNNLLSRDDDDPDDQDEESYMQEAYIPSEDLMSIFEAGIPNDEPFVVQRDGIFPEDIIYNPSYTQVESRTTNRSTLSGESSHEDRERELLSSRMRDRWFGMLLMDHKEKMPKSAPTAKTKSTNTSSRDTTHRFGEIQWWTFKDESDDSIKFSQIASLHSELISVTENGFVHQWRWADANSPVTEISGHCHSRAIDMNLTNEERVVEIAACNVRVSLVTESGKLATWLDDSLLAVGHKLEHALQTFSEFKGHAVTQLHVCDLYSCVQLANGSLHWWGVFPFEQRKKILDKVKTKAKKSAITGSGLIKTGTQVCIRSCPLYYPGAIGFTTVNGEPRVGELMEQAWTILEKCRFKIMTPTGTTTTTTAASKAKDKEKEDNDENNQVMEDEGSVDTKDEQSNIRKRKYSAVNESLSYKEEQWCLKDVIFVEEVRNVPVGRVLKVDGAYTMVNFSSRNLESGSEEEGVSLNTLEKDCRLVRKDELQIVKWTTPPKMPECFQKTPKQLVLTGNAKVLTMALDKKGVHAILKSSSGLRYVTFSLASGRPEPGGVIQQEPANFLTRTSPNTVSLHSSGADSLLLMKDPNSCLYPLVQDNIGGMQNPNWTNLSAISCLAMGHNKASSDGKSQLVVTVMVAPDNELIQSILRSDDESLLQCLKSIEGNPEVIRVCVETKCDGNRNILHLCVATCQPVSSKPSKACGNAASSGAPANPSGETSRSPRFSKALELMRNAILLSHEPEEVADVEIPTSTWPPDPAAIEDDVKDEPYKPSLWVPLFDGISCLEVMLKSSVLMEHMYTLLSEKDSLGCTPFMTAIKIRAYSAALKLYEAAKFISTTTNTQQKNKEQFMSMICPPNTVADMSPLQILCCNDTCSFTWTGTKHINQDIFECKTCGLVGPLCCCTECAQVCHVGHECKLKKTSPTAYCDCWEKCPCKSLIPGDQAKRLELLHKLVDETDLCIRPNKKGQHILLFLAQTVSRQGNEQMQYVPNRMSTGESSKQRSSSTNHGKSRSQTPPLDHDLEPPKFAKTSLSYMLKNWKALKSMILYGCSSTGSKRANALDDNVVSSSMLQTHEIGQYLDVQNGTSLLDNFVHKLIVKCNGEFLEVLLQSLQRHIVESKLKEHVDDDDTLLVVRRFIRSVVRVYVVLSACTGSTYNKRKGIFTSISKCKRVFVSLNVIAAQEMADIAATIFSPVRMGVVYPSAPFTLGSAPDSTAVSNELFSATPLPERSLATNSTSTRVKFAERPSVEDRQEEEEMESEEPSLSQSQLSNPDESQDEPHIPESDMELDLLAESESESDESNNGDGNENTTSSSTSRRGRADGYFSTTEASETEGEDEEEEEGDVEEDDDDEDDDDDDDDDNENNADTPEQRNVISNGGGDVSSAPHALQWAVRNSQATPTAPSTTAAHVPSGSGLVFIDTAQLRRSGAASACNDGSSTANSMYCTPSALARTFGILVREVSDLLSLTPDCCSLSGTCLPIEESTSKLARQTTNKHLFATWEWLWRVVETTEAQLRFGASLTAVSDPNHPQHPLFDTQTKTKLTRGSNHSTSILRTWSENRRKKRGAASSSNTTTDSSTNTRQDYLSYILSLMRSHDNEHGDSLPKVEITSLRHVAYVLDVFIYYLRSNQTTNNPTDTSHSEVNLTKNKQSKKEETSKDYDAEYRPSSSLKDEDEDEDNAEPNDDGTSDIDSKASRHRFFKRSDSTLVLGFEPADPFTPLKESLPLADRPHLLNPACRRDQLFGVMKDSSKTSCPQIPLTLKLNSDSSNSGSLKYLNMAANTYLGRWRMCLELFGRVFLDDVGSEPNSVLNELGRFDVKEAKFKREMERLRNGHQKDLYIEGLDRSRKLLLQQSLRQLNSQFGRRLPGTGPLNIHRLKVSFKDEPGEGSGVVRSFYTAISNAFLVDEKLPNLDNIFSGTKGLTHQLRARAREREREYRRSSVNGLSSGMIPRAVRRNERLTDRTAAELETCSLSLDAPVYVPNPELNENDEEDNPIPIHKRELARRIYKKVHLTWPEYANKVTGMLLDLTPTQLIYMLTHDDACKDKINEAVDLIIGQASVTTDKQEAPSVSNAEKVNLAEDEEEALLDNSPVFFQPGKSGYYSPRPGRNGPERLNCMRNVGRIIGLCLLQNELCPLSFNRHVIKYLLGRKISWHDLAFFDPTLYESLRLLIDDSKLADSSEYFSSLDLTYCIQLSAEEGGTSVELIKGGSQVEVAPDNVHDYVKKYAEYRMVLNARRSLQAMRRGLLDVVPSSQLDGLTAEDFRLLLNGAGDINVQQLTSYTFFSDETGGEGQDKLSKFKKWFWSIVENMTPKQKQDLLYFWTSSPAMPASAEGFQPMPSVTVKPANDHQLPTANTCISRLYVPLYSSKAILRSKFLLAIKTKVFGFV